MYYLFVLAIVLLPGGDATQDIPDCTSVVNGTKSSHPNCRKYWQCINSVALEETCPDLPEPLYFDDILLECNYPSVVNCTTRKCPRNLIGIEYSLTIHNLPYAGDFGVWLKDEYLQSTEGKVWALNGIRNSEVYEYNTEYDFQVNNLARTFQLPYECEGTGHVVYNNALFCHVYGTRYMGKYDISSGSYNWVELANLGMSVYDEYQLGYINNIQATAWGNGTYLDFAVDEYGLWAIYSHDSTNNNLIISRLNPSSMAILNTYNTNFPKYWAGNAFMICGRLYVIDSAIGEKTYIRYIYDTNDGTEQSLLPANIPFPSVQRQCSVGDTCPFYTNSFITSINFAVNEKPDPVIYAWNCKYQEVYKPMF